MACTSVAPELDAAGRAEYLTEHLPHGPVPRPRRRRRRRRLAGRARSVPARAHDARRDRDARQRPAGLLPGAQRALPAQRARHGPGLHRRGARPRQARGDRQARAPEPLQARGPAGHPARPDPHRRRLRRKRARQRAGRHGLRRRDGAHVLRAGRRHGRRQRRDGRRASPRCWPRPAASSGPTVAVVVSEESADYRGELTWLAGRIDALGLADVVVCKPQEIVFTEEALFVRRADGREAKLDVLYRNFELFDLLNVPKQELMLYAARHNRVKLTPPPKAHMEEKASFALFHHPELARALARRAGRAGRRAAAGDLPADLDRRPAAAPAPGRDRRPERRRRAGPRLGAARGPGQERARLRAQAVGLQRARLGLARREGRQRHDRARHGATPCTRRWPASRRRRTSCSASTRAAGCGCPTSTAPRTRSSRWTAACGCARTTSSSATKTRLGGVLATVAPADKRVIHGMTDAIMAPCRVAEDGF